MYISLTKLYSFSRICNVNFLSVIESEVLLYCSVKLNICINDGLAVYNEILSLFYLIGEKLQILDDTDDSYWYVRSQETGNEGRIPSNYVEYSEK